jgi:hypothetical protein
VFPAGALQVEEIIDFTTETIDKGSGVMHYAGRPEERVPGCGSPIVDADESALSVRMA